jgi:flagellar M-ring protein FliF
VAQLRTILTNLTPRGRMVLGGSVVGAIILLVLVMQVASRPSYQQVAGGLNPADTGKVTAALDQQGITYELRNNGTAVAVTAGDLAKARIALAEQGLPGKAQPGFELFDKQKLGSSDFQQQVAYQRALEGELAQTIGQVQGVTGAQVQLVLPQDQLFSSQESPAKAAVLLSGSMNTLDPTAVRGIAQLVASSVKGLQPSAVTITDGTGHMLWPTGQDPAAAGATAKQAVEAHYERQVESNLDAMLAQTIGPGKAVVRVAADLNTDRATQDKLQYGKKGVALSAETDTEKLRGTGATGAGGAGGTTSNIPSYAQTGGGNSNYNHTTKKTQWAVDKTVTRTQIAPGQVNHMNVALMVDSKVPRAQLAGLRAAVASAAGINPKRGDQLTVTAVPFAATNMPAVPKASPVSTYLPYAKWAGLGGALAAFLFFITRHLRRREREELADPTWLHELLVPRPLATLEAAAEAPVRAPVRRIVPEVDPAIERVREAAGAQPERIAQQVRLWMQAD